MVPLWPGLQAAKWQARDAALQRFAERYHLTPEAVAGVRDEIHQISRDHWVERMIPARDRIFHARFRRSVEKRARERARSPNPNAREHAKRMVRLDTLERRKVSRSKAIEGAIQATPDDLSPKEKQAVRRFLARTWLPNDHARSPSLMVGYLEKIAALLRRETGEPVKFSSYPTRTKPPGRAGRHHGPTFELMMAAAQLAGYQPSNEALAMRIRRIRRFGSDPQEPR